MEISDANAWPTVRAASVALRVDAEQSHCKIGEVQLSSGYAENPGNLVLNDASNLELFRTLARHGSDNGTRLWLQLGHAGALAYAPTSKPKGPTAFDLQGLTTIFAAEYPTRNNREALEFMF